jgi:hypothetical protein
MSNYRTFTPLIATFTLMRILLLFFVHPLEQNELGDIKIHPAQLVSQSKFKPPKESKPKGSSGAGSRRMFSNVRYKNLNV